MTDLSIPRYEDNNCFVCGPDNPVGLRIPFRMERDVCIGEFVPGENHVGWDNVVHGGIIFSALDDVMANWLFLQDLMGHTARCETRFRKQLRVGTAVRLEGRQLERRGRMAVMKGEMYRISDDTLLAECEARFILAGGD